MAKSPSITIREIDASTYAVTNSNTTLAIVGFGTKGPVGEAQLVTSKNEFVEKYGTAPIASPYGHLAAHRAFNYTNKIVYYRVATDDVAAEHVVLNSVAAQNAYLEFASLDYSLYLDAGKYGFALTVGEDPAEDVEITILNADWYSLDQIKTKLNTELPSTVDAIVINNKLRIVASSKETTSFSIATPGGAAITDLTEPEYLGAVGSLIPSVNEVEVGDSDIILIKSKETGSATNNISVKKTSYVNPVTTDNTLCNITVLYNQSSVEEFTKLSLDPSSEDYFLNVINKDEDNGGSTWIELDLERPEGATGVVTFLNGEYFLGKGETEYASGNWEAGTYDHKVGTDGIPTGSSNGLFIEALGNDKDLANSELFDFDILITPDNGLSSVQNAAITLAETKQNFIYIADPPFGLTYSQATDWHNGKGNGRNLPLNSSYVATYWPWVKDYDLQTDEYTWVPPSSFIAELFLKVDNNNFQWSAPAGEKRGKLITSDIEHSPSLSERDVLYGGMNAVNPIVEFNSKGIIVYGQKTTLRENSAINRINVRRMLIYVKKLVQSAVEGIIFDPHTPESWSRASSLVTSILETIRAQGGIEDYSVVINSTTNTQNLIAQGIMKGIITVVPVGTIERISLDVKFLSPGASITE